VPECGLRLPLISPSHVTLPPAPQMTPTRGFSAELATSFTVSLASVCPKLFAKARSGLAGPRKRRRCCLPAYGRTRSSARGRACGFLTRG
jgi:hypothetical protein